ncbi:branched-chain-amino-acid aminotransferase, mitochondrial [Sarcophilus harrisii]|uniref:branched-chain-amino-acid aminotransferase, mitochondrial n=1 Tax=Sarcophilus harrisii TaxID=9305 RepID=UPI001301FE98|nr:branched-chain-amino-acid aminotransferase, mitochondrial [Sarcophilus harrisii]
MRQLPGAPQPSARVLGPPGVSCGQSWRLGPGAEWERGPSQGLTADPRPQASDLQVELNQAPQKKPELGESLMFGKHFTDHMLSVEWCSQEGWAVPHIHPFRSLVLHPACSALHYGIEVAGHPFVPRVRPLPPLGSKPPSSPPLPLPGAPPPRRNYGPTVFVQQAALQQGCEQVLWLYGPDHQLTEIGTMNIFIFWTHEDGALELVTPPLDGIILPGVTRQSLLDLAQTWGEFRVSERKVCMAELVLALREGRVREVFGSGTACQVCPVHSVLYQGEHLHIPTMENGLELIHRFQKALSDIQYGDGSHEWMFSV